MISPPFYHYGDTIIFQRIVIYTHYLTGNINIITAEKKSQRSILPENKKAAKSRANHFVN